MPTEELIFGKRLRLVREDRMVRVVWTDFFRGKELLKVAGERLSTSFVNVHEEQRRHIR